MNIIHVQFQAFSQLQNIHVPCECGRSSKERSGSRVILYPDLTCVFEMLGRGRSGKETRLTVNQLGDWDLRERSQDFSKGGGAHCVKHYRHGVFDKEYCRLFA